MWGEWLEWERNVDRDILFGSVIVGNILGIKVLEYFSNYILFYGYL